MVSRLKQTTVTCHKCGLRLTIDIKMPGISYCKCATNTTSPRAVLEDWEASLASGINCNNLNGTFCYGRLIILDEDWVPFIEREDVIVWRQEHKDHKGLYAYKGIILRILLTKNGNNLCNILVFLVYGIYSDVAAKDFLAVQLDSDCRK